MTRAEVDRKGQGTPGVSSRPLASLLVTGGAGFVGSAFVRWLFRSDEFRGKVVNLDLLTYAGNLENVDGHVDPARYWFVRGDICDRELLLRTCDEHGIDTIVNFAAESHRPVLQSGRDLVADYLAGAARAGAPARVRWRDEYSIASGPTGAFREDSPYLPNCAYSASKASSDHLVRAYARTYGISTTLSHSGNSYGPYQFPEKLIPLMILNALEGKALPVYGDGLNVRDWLYVEDHCRAIFDVLAGAPPGSTFNVGGRSEKSNIQGHRQGAHSRRRR